MKRRVVEVVAVVGEGTYIIHGECVCGLVVRGGKEILGKLARKK